MGSVSHITEQKICPGKKLRCHVTSHMEIPLKMLLNIVLSNFFNRTDEKSDYKNLNICILDCFCFKRAEKKQDILITHPRLMVKDSQQVHGVIQILLSQRASERKVVEKVRTLKAFVHHSVKSGGGGGGLLPVGLDGEDVSIFAVPLSNKLDHFLACMVIQIQTGHLYL